MVYVLDNNFKPLMPTKRYGKVRRMLKENKAKVIKRCPFTIQLLYYSKKYIQPISLGVDAGSIKVGLSATTTKTELYSGEVELRNNITKLISQRREHRRSRRYRKKRYREAKYKNRKIEKGWLSPAIKQKIQTHVQVIENVCKILPIKKIIVETASFDIQKLKNPNIKNEEYQNGEQHGFLNVREYVLWRDKYICQNCFGKTKDSVLNVHHIESRQTGGNAPNNLITLCRTCHNNYHQGKIKLNNKIKRASSYKHPTFMGIMRKTLFNILKQKYDSVEETFGYITKDIRITNNLPKEHYIDARCISGNATATPLGYYYFQIKKRCHNRQIHKCTIDKGNLRKRQQTEYEIFGFRTFDKVLFKNIECFIFGKRKRGFFDLRTLAGERIAQSASYKYMILIEKTKNIITERMLQIEQFD